LFGPWAAFESKSWMLVFGFTNNKKLAEYITFQNIISNAKEERTIKK
jgi:hypothetical protein